MSARVGSVVVGGGGICFGGAGSDSGRCTPDSASSDRAVSGCAMDSTLLGDDTVLDSRLCGDENVLPPPDAINAFELV